MGLIIRKQLIALGLSTHPLEANEPATFKTVPGTFTFKRQVTIERSIVPCLSTLRTFMVILNVVPEGIPMIYGVIFWQDSMRKLDLDTRIQDSTISLSNFRTILVP